LFVGDEYSIFFEPISGELVLENATSVDGKIVYLPVIPNTFYHTVRDLQNKGAIGILTAESGGKFLLHASAKNSEFIKIAFQFMKKVAGDSMINIVLFSHSRPVVLHL
jgi:hypothetical protein